MQRNTMIINTSASVYLPMDALILLGSIQLEFVRFHMRSSIL